ncbi:cysteine-rich CWC family protein [Shewanella sp. AS16]|uniref:cysteine-rich CWC family protein n=1 Tax=Shewanella sp. AS16 TaxID=2907625 RepID=UPI001F2396AB|nr:cysteine-rich CWC family protein [Shewanella sp. AS16]MCE9685745.1 cysteine-rich CWC family protein [Shewanella sp. AS16]
MTDTGEAAMPLKERDSGAKFCPLCRQANHCAVLAGRGIEDCWCAQQTFPPLAKPADAGACICEACLRRLQQEAASGYKRLD